MSDGLDDADGLDDLDGDGLWRRSRKSNLCRDLDGLSLTVFRHGGGYKWCIADGEGSRYSRSVYDFEADAADAAVAEVREG
jgi:hypothetical protein